MYQDFGAVVNRDQVEFKLFIPDNTVDKSQYTRGGSPQIQEIRIRGDFQEQIGGVSKAKGSSSFLRPC
ncbi:hypothetical protein [Aphanothece sacrum]|uniref:1,4-alpha-glucan-branching protein n=1 Tax=Aphanothece sacrum FPU1 TaxID=1920663 RepID=A0A401IMP1_APHSA|nr:hypothetical protein [Aphanothece sacrum]GBF82540.1 1,4-alpha-glucan-branching protein [Aphanothece sacrum FPU1]GBF84674.1 1,4-alpha-glucan-branching protein [Aphanothece sacrum FPU3]